MIKHENPKIKTFAILCDSYYLQQWQAESIRLLTNNGFVPVLLIMDDRPAKPKPRRKRLQRYPWHKIIYRIYQRYLFRPEAKKMLSLKDELKNIPVLKAHPRKVKTGFYFSDDEIDAIKKTGPDFMLRFGFGILRGDILSSAPYGLWSFHHDDEKKYRGVPSNFWEIYCNDPVNASILQVLTDDIDGGPVIRKGFFPTLLHSWKSNLDQAYFRSASWPLQAARDINNGALDPAQIKGDPENSPVYRLPENSKMLRFFFQSLINRIKLHGQEMFRPEDWRIGIFQTENINGQDKIAEHQLNMPPGPGKHHYFADPFIVKTGHELHLLFEEYDYHKAKGHISGYIYNCREKKWSAKKILLNKGTHLAYPFTFREEGHIYCLPENAAAGSVELYQYDPVQQELTLHRVLAEKTAAIDASLLKYNNKWWLFFTVPGASNFELHIYWSEQLQGPYRPHANNPVKQDIRNARPGGNFFEVNGSIYRPAQDSSRSYGCRLQFMEIEKLSITEYREKPAGSLEPWPGQKFNKGLHTLSHDGDYFVCDLKRYCFNFPNFKRKMLEKMRLV